MINLENYTAFVWQYDELDRLCEEFFERLKAAGKTFYGKNAEYVKVDLLYSDENQICIVYEDYGYDLPSDIKTFVDAKVLFDRSAWADYISKFEVLH